MHYAGLSKALRGASRPNSTRAWTASCCGARSASSARSCPWNFPTTLLCNKLGPALVAGNTVVAKPAGTTPLTTLRFAELLHEAGLPAGRVQRRPRRAARWPARRWSRTRCVRKIAFTGSTPVGERVMALCAKGTKRVTLELGGSDPMIVCDDADLAAAASAASMGRFFNCGQACLAIKRVYVFDVGRRRGHRGDRRPRPSGCASGPATRPARRSGRCTRQRQRDESSGQVERTLAAAASCSPAARRPTTRRSPTASSTSRPWCSSPPHDSPMAHGGGLRPGAADLAGAGPRRGDRARQRLAVRARLVDLDARPRPRAAGGRADRGGLHLGQLAHEGLRRAAVRRLKSSGYGKEHGEEAFDYYTETKSVVVRSGS